MVTARTINAIIQNRLRLMMTILYLIALKLNTLLWGNDGGLLKVYVSFKNTLEVKVWIKLQTFIITFYLLF